jgi:uncharacterized protein (DUF1330 family)
MWRGRVLARRGAFFDTAERLLCSPRGPPSGLVDTLSRDTQAREGLMSAYFIVDIDIHDAAGLEEYRNEVPSTIAKYGGRFLVRGGKFETLEGNWQPKRLVMLEFPSVEQAKKWYDSDEYRPLKTMRFKASNANLLLVEGV